MTKPGFVLLFPSLSGGCVSGSSGLEDAFLWEGSLEPLLGCKPTEYIGVPLP